MRHLLAWTLLCAALLWAAAILGAPRVLAMTSDGARAAGPRTVQHERERRWLTSPAAMMYLAGSFICHQRPERSFRAAGYPFPVCARCTGLYLGAPLGLAVVLLVWPRRAESTTAGRARPLTPAVAPAPEPIEAVAAGRTYTWWRQVLGLAAVPTVVSVGIEQVFGWSSNGSRALAAMPLGAAVAALAGAALMGVLSGPLLHYRERRVPGGRADQHQP